MVEIAGLVLGVVGILFAFEAPRRRLVGLFSRSSLVAEGKDVVFPVPVVDICRRGIVVSEVEPEKLHFDIPYCAGKNANAHNVKLQTAILRAAGSDITFLSTFGDDFPDHIVLTYEVGKSISYTLSPLKTDFLPSLYIVVRGTYTAEFGERVFPIFDVFKFGAFKGNWMRTLGNEDKRVRTFIKASSSGDSAQG